MAGSEPSAAVQVDNEAASNSPKGPNRFEEDWPTVRKAGQLMVFVHKITGLTALMTGIKDFSGGEAIEVNRPSDLPDIEWCEHFNFPPEIVKGQGKPGLLCYLKAFEVEKHDRIYLWFLPSGFPNMELPIINSK